MSELTIHYYNETYCKVEAPDTVLYELNDLFSFYVPGFRYMPDYKNKIWDGKTRLFYIDSQMLMVGHVGKVVKFCQQNNISYSIDDKVKNQISNPDYDYDDVENFLNNLDLRLKNGKAISPYEEQRKAVHTALKTRRRLLISPTSSGKSLITFLILEYYMRNGINGQFLVTVPRVALVKQLYDNFLEYIHDGCAMTPDDVHAIFASKEKTTNHKITIATWQGIYKMPKNWFKRFSVGICDEAHEAKSGSLQTIYRNLVNAKYKIGMTGTLDDSKLNPLIIEGLTGYTTHITKTKELMEQGKVAPLKIKTMFFKYSHDESFSIKKFTYTEEIKYIVHHEKRNRKI